MPACAWKVSGGSLAWSRDCSRSFAAEPAPPATAPLMNSTSGYLSARVATSPSRPAFSPPDVHQVKTSTWVAAPAGLVAPGEASLSLSLPLHAASSRLTAAAPATRPVYLLCMRMSVLRLHRRNPGRCRLRGVGAWSHPSQPPTPIQPLRSVGVKK